MSSKIELLPCPFCGGAPTKRCTSGDERDGYADHVSYVCAGCGCAKGACGNSAKGGYADNSKVEELALSAWNKRAAPVVERQPVAEVVVSGGAHREYIGVILADGVILKHGEKLYTAPPELAELQAKNEELDLKYSMSIKKEVGMRLKIDELQATIARLTAEIERLKGGQGEPVATIHWQQPSCDWTLTMLCEPAIMEAERLNLYMQSAPDTRPSHANAPADSGTHPHNDGLDDYRGSKK